MPLVDASLRAVVAAVDGLAPGRRIVAVDGVDGAGKTTFADALVDVIDRRTVRASVDGFHHPRAVRYHRGRESPDGFYRDSFDLPALAALLLDPFATGQPIRTAVFDHLTDTPIECVPVTTEPDSVLLLDGLFLHRPELRDRWDVLILLDVPFAVAAQRMARRDGAPPDERYVVGQQLYFREADPARHATLVLPW